jgi:3-oxoacyl-[acyl-carrier protein] reductase
VGRLDGQGWVVTGGSRGIGRAVVLAAAARGAQVVCCGRSSAAPQWPSELPRAPLYLRADVTKEADVEALFDFASDKLAQLHVVVNNAGVRLSKLLVDLTLDEWNEVLATNVQGPFLVCRRAVEELMGQGEGGRLVNVGSFAANGLVGEAAYSASKAALAAMTRSIAKEYGKKGITCNAVVPGFVTTDMTATFDDAARDSRARLSAAARFATAEEVAEAVLFFASSEASFVTGDSLVVAGGVRDVPVLPARRERAP